MASLLERLGACSCFGGWLSDPCCLAAELVVSEKEPAYIGEVRDRKARLDFACPGLNVLLGYCDSAPQRRFLGMYVLTQEWRRRGLIRAMKQRIEKGWLSTDGANLLIHKYALAYPALIPEVWINFVHREHKTDTDRLHLQQNPGRVDFVVLGEQRRCVIEIDGPSHYATYDSTSGYTVDERLYTKNLRIERSLRRQGWEIHRFSNLEVMETNRFDDFAAMTADFPSATPLHSYLSDAEADAMLSEVEDDDIPF